MNGPLGISAALAHVGNCRKDLRLLLVVELGVRGLRRGVLSLDCILSLDCGLSHGVLSLDAVLSRMYVCRPPSIT